MSIHLILTTNSWSSYAYLHFIDEEIRAQKDEMSKITLPVNGRPGIAYWINF